MLGDKNARSAVLLLHGFTGSPWEIRPLAEALAARGAFVSGPRLPGHGTTPEAMLYAGWRDWVEAAQVALLELGEFERVFVGGLSMGGLLALILAGRHPKRVSKVVLMAPVLKLQSRIGQLVRLVRHRSFGLLGQTWVAKDGTDIENDEVRAQAPVLSRFPVTSLFELFTLQDVARLAIPLVRQPTLIAAAANDHVVDLKSLQTLHTAMPGSRYLLLQRGFHILPRDTDRAQLHSEVSQFLADDG
jgi:carboxylesterase